MGAPSSVTSGAPWMKSALVCLGVALLLHLIAFGTPHWARTDLSKVERNEYFGMWQYCSKPVHGGRQLCQDFIYYINTGDWLKGCQAFSTLSFFVLLPSIVFVLLCSFVDSFIGEIKYQVMALAFTATSVVFLVITIAIFAGKYEEYFRDREGHYEELGNVGQLSWGFGLMCSSLFLSFVSMLLILVEMMIGDDDPY